MMAFKKEILSCALEFSVLHHESFIFSFLLNGLGPGLCSIEDCRPVTDLPEELMQLTDPGYWEIVC